MATRTGDVAGTVQEVIAAFDKATKLVQRIEKKNDNKNDPEDVQDLFRSLSLGPIIVKGFFDADSKRFGASYLIGDYQAQVELRDVLLGMKGLVGELQEVLLDDAQVDFRQLQEISDACKSNAGVSLGQLSQRLVRERDPMSMQLQSPQQYQSGVSSPALQYSSSRSTHSSSDGRMPKTPDPYLRQQRSLSHQWYAKRTDSKENQLPHQRRDTEQGRNSDWLQTSQFVEREPDELSLRRRSSHTLAPEDDALLSPASSMRRQGLPGQQDTVRDSFTPFALPAGHQHSNSGRSRARYGPDDFSPVEQHGPFRIDRDSAQSMTSYASRATQDSRSTIEDVIADYRYSAEPEPLRMQQRQGQQPSDTPYPPPCKPVPAVPYESFTGHPPISKHTEIPIRILSSSQNVAGVRRGLSRASAHAPEIAYNQPPPAFQPSPQVQRAMLSNQMRQHPSPQSPSARPYAEREDSYSSLSSATQSRSPHQSPQQRFPTQLSASPPTTKKPSMTTIPIPQDLPLSLPTEKTPHPFCKGAFRLFVGLNKKAFAIANRPTGMMGYVPYWRCDKCLFEGVAHEQPGPPDKKGRPGKAEKAFDPRTRECGPISTAIVGPDGRGEGSGGIRYKWIFIAKCHVPLKTPPEGPSQLTGSFGGYACIFCCAEGANRGWTSSTGAMGLGVDDAASTLSGKSGSSTAGSTPVFGNIAAFMDHLQMHRREENWPCKEMRSRMRCVVGRVADRTEDWEVNFLPY